MGGGGGGGGVGGGGGGGGGGVGRRKWNGMHFLHLPLESVLAFLTLSVPVCVRDSNQWWATLSNRSP